MGVKMRILFLLIGFSLLQFSCQCSVNFPMKVMSGPPDVEGIELPDGFKIHVYAEDIVNARSLSLSPGGVLFVGSRKTRKVWAMLDTDGDMVSDQRYLVDEDLNVPCGVAIHDGDLYVSEINRILRYDDIEASLANPPEPVVITDRFPDETHHGWKYIAFGPDDKLYVPVGAPCNVCLSEEIFSTITRMNPDGSDFEIVAHGVRNTVGFDWDPETGDLWFTDNGRDWLGDDMPFCELNHLTEDGLHFGFPYCHQGDMADPKFGDRRSCSEFEPPYQNLGPHVAPLGMEFYEAGQFPGEYSESIFIAEHGSWNRSTPLGYRITMVDRSKPEGERYIDFATGWLTDDGRRWGRPVDLEWMPDGSLLVSDDFADTIYRIYYDGK